MTEEAQKPPPPSPPPASGPGQRSAGTGDPFSGWMQVAPFGILATDTELKIRGWNRWLVTHSGLSEAAVLGRPLFEVFPGIPERRLEGAFHRALLGETAVLSTALHQYLLPLPAGSREFGQTQMRQTARVAPLHAGGDVVGTITILEDVTQREQQARVLRRQQEHDRLLSSALALLLESSHPMDAVSELFPRIATSLKLDVFFNFIVPPGANEMHLQSAAGVPPEVRRNLARVDLDDPLPCAWCAKHREPIVVSHVQTSQSPFAEAIRKLGLRSYAAFPLLIGDRVLGMVSFGSYARDLMAEDEIGFLRTVSQYLAVTIDRAQRDQALREAQATLSRHAETLESKVAERTAALRETIEELEGFSHTVAHDLRAPIRWLFSYSEVLLEDYGETMPAGALALVRRLQHAGHRLDALTRDLLSFSKLTREEVVRQPVAAEDVITDLLALTPGLQDKVAIEGRLGRVMAQRTLLQQCLSNLFDNALKFAKPGRVPRIVVRMEPRPRDGAPTDAPRVRLWIEDNGIGVAPEMRSKIFGIFERARGVDHIEGTGVGLAIVARATQRMGGACGVESEVGVGSRFWIDLPAA